MSVRSKHGLYVQFGCGWCAPDTWLNFDSSPVLRFERIPLISRLYTKNPTRFPPNVRYGDIVRGLPVMPGACRGIYGSHVLEHLALDEFDIALSHVFTYLEEGGTFRLVVPDLGQMAADYVASTDPLASIRFLKESGLGRTHRPRSMGAFIGTWLSHAFHLWMWDEAAMRAKLEEHGFSRIRRATFGDAEDGMFRAVEDHGRFQGCLAMECIR